MFFMMKISRLLKILEDLVVLKFSDPKGKHGRQFYRNLHRILRAFLLQDGLPVKIKLQALTASIAVYAKVRIHEQIVSEDANNCIQFIVLEAARVLLETEFLKLKEKDPSRCLFVQMVQQTKCNLKSCHDGRLFETLDRVLVNEWSHPVLLKMLRQEHCDSETIPFAAFIGSIENPEILRLRVRLLVESGCHDLADNLISWCVASGTFDDDAYILLRRLDFLHASDREEQFHQLCRQISCCTARKLLESAKQGTVVSVDPATILTMSRTFLLLDWIKITDLSCTKELLRHWLTLEYEHLNGEHRLAVTAFNKVIALANSVRQLVLFVDLLESQFGEVFRTFCSELMEKAIRQERHRLVCARLYLKDAENARDATESLVAICGILGRVYKDHWQMRLLCRLCCLYLDPTVKDFYSLETEYANLKSPPPTEPAPPPWVCASAYRALLSTVELLRPESFALSASWMELKPVVVQYMEGAGFGYNWAKNRFRNWQKPVEPGTCLGRKTTKTWKGMTNADAADGSKRKSSVRKGQAKISNGFAKSNRVRTDLAKLCQLKKELKASAGSNRKKQNPNEKRGTTLRERSVDFASNEHESRKIRRLDSVAHPKRVAQLVVDAPVDNRDIAGGSVGENSTDSFAVSKNSASVSEIRRKSLLARRYVWNSQSSVPACPVSTSNPPKFSSLDRPTLGTSDKETACRESRDSSKNSELNSNIFGLNSDTALGSLSNHIDSCSNNSSNPCFTAVGRLDKNSNLDVLSIAGSSAAAFNSFSRNSCSYIKSLKANADVPKTTSHNSTLSAWESKYLAYCSSTSKSKANLKQSGTNLTVANTNLDVVNTDLILVPITSVTTVFSSRPATTVLSSSTAKRGINTTQSGFLESLPSSKVVGKSENQTPSLGASSYKSSELQLMHSRASNAVAKDAETSVSTVSEKQDPVLTASVELPSADALSVELSDRSTSINLSNVTPNSTTVEDFGVDGDASVMTDACQSSKEAVTPVASLDDMVSCSDDAPHNSVILASDCAVELPVLSVMDSGRIPASYASSDTESHGMVVLPMTSAVQCCREVAHYTGLVAETWRELSTVSDLIGEISEESVSQSPYTREKAPPGIQSGVLQSNVPVTKCTAKFDKVAKDACSNEEPVAAEFAAVVAISRSVACTSEKLAPSISASTQNLMEMFQKGMSRDGEPQVQNSSVCSVTEEAVLTSSSVSLNSCCDASSNCTHLSSTSLPVEATSVVTVTASDDSSTSGVAYCSVSVQEEMSSAYMVPQAAADSLTCAVHELGQESALPISATDTMLSLNQSAAAAPGSAVDIEQTATIINYDIGHAATSAHDFITGSNKTYLDVPEASDAVSVLDNLPDLPQDVLEMLETVGQKVTCSKKKRDSADFVQKLSKLLKSDRGNGSSSGSPSLSGGSDIVERSVEPNAFDRNNDPGGLHGTKVLAMDAEVISEISHSSRSLRSAETSGNDGLNDPQIDRLPDCVTTTVCGSLKEACINKASVSENFLAGKCQGNDKQISSLCKKLLEADHSLNLLADQTVHVGTDNTSGLQKSGELDTKTDHLMDMSMINARKIRQHLLLYDSLRQEQEHERNQDNRYTLAMLQFEGVTVPVSPTNLFYYERACPRIRGMLTNSSSPSRFDPKTDNGCSLSNMTNTSRSAPSSQEKRHLASLLTPLGDGEFMEGVENKALELYTEPATDKGENSDKCSSELIAGDEVICSLCDKSLASDRGLRMHLVKFHEMDFINRRSPEEGYRCRLCGLHRKLLFTCTCRRKNSCRKTAGVAVSPGKPLEVPSCHKREAKCSDNRNVLLLVRSDCNGSSRSKSNSQSNDRSNRRKNINRSNDSLSRVNCNSHIKDGRSTGKSKDRSSRRNICSQSRERSSLRNKSVGSSLTSRTLGKSGTTEGSSDNRSRKRVFDDSKQSTDNSSASPRKKRSSGEPAGRAERSIKCRSRRRVSD